MTTSNDHQELDGERAAPETDIAGKLSELARSLQRQESEHAVLEGLTQAAIHLVPGADEASITLVTGRRRVESRAPSGELARILDELQEQTGEGPCLSAVYEHQTVSVPNMSEEPRWPEFSSRAAAAGAGSMLSFQLFVHEDNLGALNLVAQSPRAFTDESQYIGLLLASHAAIAFADAQKLHQFKDAVATRDLIGQAKGILMERYGITAGQAFMMLVRVSTDTNTKLLAVAEQLATTGSLPAIGNGRRRG